MAGPALICLILAYVLLPVLVVTVAAFNAKPLLSFPPDAWSWRWFGRVFTYPDFQHGFKASLIITVLASTIASVIGTGLVIIAKRTYFPGKEALQAILLSPLVVPHFTIGLGLLMLAFQVGVERGYAIVILCHVILVLPFVLRSVFVSMENLDPALNMPRPAWERRR